MILLNVLLYVMVWKEVKDMAVVYATLIIKDKKKFHEVPPKLKEQVREILIDMELPELATEQ